MLNRIANNGRERRRFVGRKNSFPRIAVVALAATLALTLAWTPMPPHEDGGAGTHANADAAHVFGGMGIGSDAVYAADPVYGTYEVTVALESSMSYGAIETVFNMWYENNGYVGAGAAPADYLGVGKLTVVGSMGSSAFSFIQGELTGLREIDIASASIPGGAYPNYAFRYMKIKAARIPANIPLSQQMFLGCQYLTTVTAGTARPMVAGTTGVDLADYAPTAYNGSQHFSGTAVAAVRLPASAAIAQGMFRGCKNLRTLVIGTAAFTENVVDLRGYTASSYGEYAFYSTGLVGARIPSNVPLSERMFAYSDLSALAVGDAALQENTVDLTGYTPTSYGDMPFDRCNTVKVRLPASIPLSDGMFYACDRLTTLTFGDRAFEDGVIDLRGYSGQSYNLQPFYFGRTAVKMRIRANIPLADALFQDIGTGDAVTVESGTLTPGVVDLSGYTGGSYGIKLFEGANGVSIRFPASTQLSELMFYNAGNLTIACGQTPFTPGVVDLSGYTASAYGDSLFAETGIVKVRLPAGIPLCDDMFFRCYNLRTLALGARAFDENVIDLTGYTPSSYGEKIFLSTKITRARIPANVPVSKLMFSVVGDGQGLTSLAVGSAPFQENTIDLAGYTAPSYGVGVFGYTGAVRVRVPANIPLSEQMFVNCKNLRTFVCGSAAFADGVIDLTGYECSSYGKTVFSVMVSNAAEKQVRLKGNIPVSQEMFYCSDKITSFTFWGGSAAPVVASDAFTGCATTGTVYYPQGASGYVAGSFGGSSLSKWTFTPRADLVADLGTPPGDGDPQDPNEKDNDKDNNPPTQYTVTLNPNGGKAVSAVKRNSGAALGTLPIPSRAGYTFLGWYTAAKGGTKAGPSTPVKENVTLYAHWQANNTLKSLKASKGKLSPAFNPAKASYKIKLTKKQTSTKLTAAKISSGAKLQIKIGKGKWKTATKATIKLAKGKKVKVQLRVVCKGLKTKTYSITVTRGR